MKPSSAKNKGALFQKAIRKAIQEVLGLEEDDVLSRSMGANGEDIMLSPAARKLFPYSVECKRTERLNFYAAWDQTISNSGKYEPLLFSKRNRKPPLVTMSSDHFFTIYKELLENRSK